LAKFFGTDDIKFTIGSDGYAGMKRTFKSFSAAAREAGRSRIFGGIHYEFDNRHGQAAGRAVALDIWQRLLLPADKMKLPDEDEQQQQQPGGPPPLPKAKKEAKTARRDRRH